MSNQKLFFSKEQINHAKQVSIVDVAMNLGYELVKDSVRAFKVKDSGGLFIYPQQNRFYHMLTEEKGNVIDFVSMEQNKSFTEAVDYLLSTASTYPVHLDSFMPSKIELPEKGELVLPERAQNIKRVYAYLVGTRKIDPKIVSMMIGNKSVYQDDRGNCVFVGRDKKGNPQYCALRGTLTGKQFRMDVANSDKGYPFLMTGKNDRVFVFESPIEVMSHATLTKLNGYDYTVSHRISLGGYSPKALQGYLERNPNISQIVLALNNDEQGLKAISTLKDKYSSYNIKVQLPKLNDFNDDLVFRLSQNEHSRESQDDEELER